MYSPQLYHAGQAENIFLELVFIQTWVAEDLAAAPASLRESGGADPFAPALEALAREKLLSREGG